MQFSLKNNVLTGVFLKGKIAEVKIYNRFFDDVNSIFEDNNDLVQLKFKVFEHFGILRVKIDLYQMCI